VGDWPLVSCIRAHSLTTVRKAKITNHSQSCWRSTIRQLKQTNENHFLMAHSRSRCRSRSWCRCKSWCRCSMRRNRPARRPADLYFHGGCHTADRTSRWDSPRRSHQSCRTSRARTDLCRRNRSARCTPREPHILGKAYPLARMCSDRKWHLEVNVRGTRLPWGRTSLPRASWWSSSPS